MREHYACLLVLWNVACFCVTLLVKLRLHTFCVLCGSCMCPANPKHIHTTEPQYQGVVVVVGVAAMVPATYLGKNTTTTHTREYLCARTVGRLQL